MCACACVCVRARVHTYVCSRRIMSSACARVERSFIAVAARDLWSKACPKIQLQATTNDWLHRWAILASMGHPSIDGGMVSPFHKGTCSGRHAAAVPPSLTRCSPALPIIRAMPLLIVRACVHAYLCVCVCARTRTCVYVCVHDCVHLNGSKAL